ncbi:hypothetical protein Pmani_008012 [Petrolisthes manimaculis]|uniref:Deubiquitinating enzyme MINDY-3/4 conserved domain-containing protein n=1 Tax=Petrolisthes manimaculis TaxID=1843537 RepID=A0AAE1UJG0_9EUCA|nr:hypothetical protein Pmani_008012 [Petrolisthes manimaculis]
MDSRGRHASTKPTDRGAVVSVTKRATRTRGGGGRGGDSSEESEEAEFPEVGEEGEHVLYPSRSRTCIRQAPIVGGEPISSDTATELRLRVFGAADLRSFSLEEWLLLPFSFNEAGSPQAYGLRVHSASTKGMAMSVQAYLLKHLLFSHVKPSGVGDVAKSDLEWDHALRVMCVDVGHFTSSFTTVSVL